MSDGLSLLSLFASSFLSATLLPGNSEVVLVAMLVSGVSHPWVLVLTATMGNSLGGVTNVILGRFFPLRKTSRWQEKATGWLKRYGAATLLFKSNARQYTMPKKLVLRGIFPGVNVLRYNGFSQDNHFCLRDFENIVCICSDTPTPATGGGLSMVDRLTAMRNTEFTGEVSDENGWRCRLFENGNVHICIDSISLLNALNDLISIYFANQLPAAGKK